MPTRILREGILSSERVDKIAGDAPVEVTYRRLISVADDFGRFTAHPTLLRAALYPLRLDQYNDVTISEHLNRCESAGLIRLYAVEGKSYLELLNFKQRTRAQSSKFPPPDGRVDTVASGWHSPDACPTNDRHPQAESESESDTETLDIDCLPTNRTNRDSRADGVLMSPSMIKQYPRLREALHRYMKERGEQEHLYPKDRTVVDVMEAAAGASEEEVIACLVYLYMDRGLKPGTRNGPRHWSWFKTTVQDHFEKKRQRADSANPCGFSEWQDRNDYLLSKAEFDAMTDAF